MTGMHRNSVDAESGFTLMEALIALVIFSVAILTFERTVAGAWRGISTANLRSGAISLALRKLEEAGAATPLFEAGESEGRTGAYVWLQAVAPVDVPREPGLRANQVVVPYWVDVTVSWQNSATLKNDQVHYRLLKLGKPQ